MADRSAVQRGDRMLAYLTLTPSVALLVLLVAVPLVTVFALALQSVSTGSFSGRWVGFDNFIWAIASRDFLRALVNTFVWVFGSVGFEMVIGLGLALLLNKAFVLRGAARAIILAPYLVPTVVAVMVWRYMLHDIVGVVNYILTAVGLTSGPLPWLNSPRTAMISVIMVGVWKFFPFVVIALLGILQAIPQEQYESARIDGASAFQQFWRITLPHIMPVFILSALIRTIWTFHKFDIIYLLTGGGPLDATTTLPVLVYLQAFSDFEFGRAAALAVIALAILILLMSFYLYAMKRAEDRQ
jgi:multiple sugar transport system permease protein